MSALDPEQLMTVYRQSNIINARRRYRECPEDMALCREEEDFLAYLREDFYNVKGAFYAVWAVDDAYCSALRMEPYKDGLLLEALETAPHARRKGYACALISAVIDHCQRSGYKAIYSHIRKGNKPSLGAHKKCGFMQISDSAVLLDGTVTRNYCTMRLAL